MYKRQSLNSRQHDRERDATRQRAAFDPDTPLEKLRWAREMQRNFQKPMSSRAMRLCTSCSERWDTAEDGGGEYRWVKTVPSAASMFTAV